MTSAIRQFELEVKLQDGSKLAYGYKNKYGQIRARVKKLDTDGHRMRQDYQDAIESTEKLLSELAPWPSMSTEELLRRSRSALSLEDEAIAHLEVEIEFLDGTEIEAETRRRLRH